MDPDWCEKMSWKQAILEMGFLSALHFLLSHQSHQIYLE